MMGFRLFITGRKTANSYFLCPLLTYLSKTAVVTCRTVGFSVWVGYPRCLEFKRKFLLILSINLLTCIFCFSMYLMNLFNFEVNIFFLSEGLNDYLTFSFGFYCLFFPKPVHMITITFASQRTSCQVLLVK